MQRLRSAKPEPGIRFPDELFNRRARMSPLAWKPAINWYCKLRSDRIYFRMGANGDAHVRRACRSFSGDVLVLEGESPEAIRDGVHIALTDCEEIYRAQEVNRRRK